MSKVLTEKVCTDCGVLKVRDEFHVHRTSGIQSTCKICTKARAKRRAARHRAHINNLKNRPCQDCTRSFPPECMDFDHRPGEKKLFTIGSNGSYQSLKKLLVEVAKCDVVCACCHRIRTTRRQRGQ